MKKKVTYYEVEWTDRNGKVHFHYYIPSIVPLMATSFYIKCENPKQDATDFVNHLIETGLFPFRMAEQETEVKL